MTEKTASIDFMSVNDLMRVMEIEKACFTDPWPYSIFLKDLESEDTITLIARLNRKIVGFAICMQIEDEFHLTNIAVHPDFQRKKVGHRLIERLLYIGDRSKTSIMYLDVRRSNTQAISFYKRYGFNVLYERKNYYKNPSEDALVMVLKLSERSKSGVV